MWGVTLIPGSHHRQKNRGVTCNWSAALRLINAETKKARARRCLSVGLFSFRTSWGSEQLTRWQGQETPPRRDVSVSTGGWSYRGRPARTSYHDSTTRAGWLPEFQFFFFIRSILGCGHGDSTAGTSSVVHTCSHGSGSGSRYTSIYWEWCRSAIFHLHFHSLSPPQLTAYGPPSVGPNPGPRTITPSHGRRTNETNRTTTQPATPAHHHLHQLQFQHPFDTQSHPLQL